MVVTADGIYVGTAKDGGCQVYRYTTSLGWKPIVRTGVGLGAGEQPDGFGDPINVGARSMIEYPVNSKNILLGTFTPHLHIPQVGCEVWMRYK
jgi:hypothetical protein